MRYSVVDINCFTVDAVFLEISTQAVYRCSVKEIFDIIVKKTGEQTAYNIVCRFVCPVFWRHCCWEGLYRFRISPADVFWKSHCRTICTGNFIRCKAGGISGDDLSSQPWDCVQFPGDDSGCFCGIYDIHGLYLAGFQKSKENVHAGYLWCYDWIYLLGGD